VKYNVLLCAFVSLCRFVLRAILITSVTPTPHSPQLKWKYYNRTRPDICWNPQARKDETICWFGHVSSTTNARLQKSETGGQIGPTILWLYFKNASILHLCKHELKHFSGSTANNLYSSFIFRQNFHRHTFIRLYQFPWNAWQNYSLLNSLRAVNRKLRFLSKLKHPSTSVASSDYWWRSGVKERKRGSINTAALVSTM